MSSFLTAMCFKVMELDLLSLESVARFAEAWNARSGRLHALINNAGIFSIGGLYMKGRLPYNYIRKQAQTHTEAHYFLFCL